MTNSPADLSPTNLAQTIPARTHPVRTILAHRMWLAAILLTVVISAIIKSPAPYRDVLFAGLALLAVLGALVNLPATWALYLALIPVLRLSGGLFGFSSLIMTRILVLSLTGVLLLKHWDSGALRALFRSNGFRFFGLFVLANVVSAAHVFDRYALYSALTYVEPLLMFAVSFYLAALDRENETRMVRAVLIGGCILAVVGVYEIATQQSIALFLRPEMITSLATYLYAVGSDRFGLGGRISSFVGQPVMASLVFALLPVLALYYLENSKHARWLQLGAGVVCGVLVLATGTRGGMLALAAALVVLALVGPQSRRERVVLLLIVAGLALVPLLLLPNLRTFLTASLDFAANPYPARNIVGRFALTRELLRYFQAHWFWGYGPGVLQKQAAAGLIPTVEGIRSLAGIENQYAAILADGGILAGIPYLLFMVGVVRDAVRMMRQPSARRMGVTLLALFAAYFVFAATETTLTVIPNLLLMAIYGAFAGAFTHAPRAAKS